MRKVMSIATSIFLAVAIVIPSISMSGCSASTAATKAQAVIGGILQVAQAEIQPGSTAIPAKDLPAVTAWVNLGVTLNAQLGSCNSAATAAGNKKAAFLACFNTFVNGLLSPSELTQLRVISPSSQSKVILWATAAALGVNVAIAAFGGTEVATPVTVPATTTAAPSTADLEHLRRQVEALGIATE